MTAQQSRQQIRIYVNIVNSHRSFPYKLSSSKNANLQDRCGGYLTTYLQQFTDLITLDVIRRLAQALCSSADALVFDGVERNPDEDLRFQFEAVTRMPAHERDAIRTMIEAMIVKSQVTGVLAGVGKTSSR